MTTNNHLLGDLRVVEIGDEISAYAGKLLAGLGADVIKIEPPDGCPTRNIGPFYQDEPGPERSLFWWHYSIGKRSVTLDLTTEDDRATLLQLLATADLFLDARPQARHRRPRPRRGRRPRGQPQHRPSRACPPSATPDPGPTTEAPTSSTSPSAAP